MKLKVNKDNEAVTCQLQQHNKGTKNEKKYNGLDCKYYHADYFVYV